MKIVLFSLMLAVAFISARPARADELKLVPSVFLKEEYNDNIFLSASDRKSDFISTLTPGIVLSDRSEKLDANLLLRLNGILYSRTSELDSVDQDYRGRLGYIFSPRTKISAEAGYTLDSQPDREYDTTGLIIPAAVKRHRQQYSLAVEQSLTEKTSVALSYSYQQDDYDSSSFSDLKYHDANIILSHDLDWLLSQTKGSVSFDYAHYNSSATLNNGLPSDSKVDNCSLTVGVSRAVSELWSVQASAGARYTLSKYRSWNQVFEGYYQDPNTGQVFAVLTNSPVEQKTHDWGWVGQTALSYKGEKNEGSLSFSYDVQPASGQTSGTTVRLGLVADMRRRFTYELSGDMAVGYYSNKSNPGAIAGQAIDEETVFVAPSVRYEFNKDMYMEASYRYARVNYNISRQEADRNSFFVRLYFQHPFFM